MTTVPDVSGDASPGAADAGAKTAPTRSETRLIRLLTGIFILALIYALYFARDFVMPVVLAFLLALMLTPIVRFLKKRGVPEALSAVYTFYDPDEADRGLGTLAILRQLEWARRERRRHVYLGYWIEGHPKMDYKRRFRPLEAFDGRQWHDLPVP